MNARETALAKLGVVAIVAVLCGTAIAEPYWISYEGNDFPENQGWQRNYGNEVGPFEGGAIRAIENGTLSIDSTRSDQIYDFYQLDRSLNPNEHERLIAEWSVLVHESAGSLDTGLVFARDGGGTLTFRHGIDHIVSKREGWTVSISPGESHHFRIESSDMIEYAFSIDGVFVRNGSWDLFSLNESYVAFGDGVQGGSSRAAWDYLRFGVVPEGATGLSLLVMALLGRRRQCPDSLVRCG